MADSLAGLAADLRLAAFKAPHAVHGVVKRGATNIKRDWRANARHSAGEHGPSYPSSITYDISPPALVVTAEIGPDKGLRQGALGNLIEFGSKNNPPNNDGGRALRVEEPKFGAALADAVADLL